MPKKLYEEWEARIARKIKDIAVPDDFIEFNRIVGNPIHPNTGERTDMFDFQEDYYKAVQNFHKVILNKSRKIGATETALRIIAFNCFDHYNKRHRKSKGRYVGHHIMIVAGNKQSVANGFISRFRDIFKEEFRDLHGNVWKQSDIMDLKPSNKITLFNGTTIEAYPASESVRGEKNVICIFMSEAAFINLLDDSRVYKAVRPNISNIDDADFILESTPNGRRGFFFDIWDKAQNKKTDFYPLLQPYTVGLHKILSEKDVENAKKEYTKDFFEQEFCCKFSTSGNQAFNPDEVIFREGNLDRFDDL